METKVAMMTTKATNACETYRIAFEDQQGLLLSHASQLESGMAGIAQAFVGICLSKQHSRDRLWNAGCEQKMESLSEEIKEKNE